VGADVEVEVEVEVDAPSEEVAGVGLVGREETLCMNESYADAVKFAMKSYTYSCLQRLQKKNS
jgi:hypothetical protein